jgi:hypothetical protein
MVLDSLQPVASFSARADPAYPTPPLKNLLIVIAPDPGNVMCCHIFKGGHGVMMLAFGEEVACVNEYVVGRVVVYLVKQLAGGVFKIQSALFNE